MEGPGGGRCTTVGAFLSSSRTSKLISPLLFSVTLDSFLGKGHNKKNTSDRPSLVESSTLRVIVTWTRNAWSSRGSFSIAMII